MTGKQLMEQSMKQYRINVPRTKKPIILALLCLFFFIVACSKSLPSSEQISEQELPSSPLDEEYLIDDGFRIEEGGIGEILLLTNGTYRLYAGTITHGLVAAESVDGLYFSSPIETRLAASGPSIIQREDGTYRMYYKTNMQGTYHPIYSAVSKDGLTWEEEGLRFDNKGEPCHGFTSVPDAVVLPDGRIRIYFVCGEEAPPKIRSIISSDGINFVLEKGVRLSFAADPSVMRMPDDTFRMYYAVPGSMLTVAPIAIGTAVSTDGLNWTVQGNVTNVEAFKNKYPDARRTTDPAAVLMPDGRVRIYFYLWLTGEEGGIVSVTSKLS